MDHVNQILSSYFFLNISLLLFTLGMWTIFAMRSNLILILIALEMVLLSINILLVFFSIYLDDLLGQVFALFVLTVAAAESAIGLAILVAYYRLRSNISVELLATAKG